MEQRPQNYLVPAYIKASALFVAQMVVKRVAFDMILPFSEAHDQNHENVQAA